MVFQNDILAGASGTAAGYTIDQSIRFDKTTSSKLQQTQVTPDGDSWTISFWLKRGKIDASEMFIVNGANGNPDYIRFETSEKLRFRIFSRGIDNTTTAVFRDPSAWYHFVANYNASTGAYNLWQNNVSLISGTGSAGATDFNKASTLFTLMAAGNSVSFTDGYLAEVVKLDNIVSDPTSFGEYDSVSGVWIPKAYAGTYGTNGFYITGADSADFGADYSGNGNDFTSSGLTASDQMPDSPTDNYCTLNPLTGVNAGSSVVTEANGNLEGTMTANYVGTFGTLGANSGKYYFEYSYAADGNYSDGRLNGGVVCVETADHGYFRIDGSFFYFPDRTTEGNYMILHRNGTGELSNTGTSRIAYNTSLSSASATGGPEGGPDIYMVALDLDNNNIYWGKNGTWYGSGGTSGSAYTDATPAGILSTHQGKYFAPAFWFNGATSGTTTVLNCGQDATFGGRYSSPAGDFYYTPPTGFSALSTANLPEPTIKDGSAHFNTILYTGNGSATTRSLTGVGFQPDFVWKKIRSSADHHWLHDAVRGADKGLNSNRTDSEYTSTRLTSFDSDGFSFATSDPDTNGSGSTYVAWNWLAGNGTASNTDGTITSTVSANQTAGFSIVTYTGTGSAATVGHGLGAEPQFIAIKGRTNVDSWGVYPGTSMGYGGQYRLKLNETSPVLATSVYWNNTDATSSVFTVNTDAQVNGSGVDYVAYCWNEVEGFSKIGKYTGNGSADGPFLWCGFRPAFVLVKRTNTADNWVIVDSSRNSYNVANLRIYPDTTNADITSTIYDFLSNGFKLRASDGGVNGSGSTYIFMAFAEHPFGGSGVAPVPAR